MKWNSDPPSPDGGAENFSVVAVPSGTADAPVLRISGTLDATTAADLDRHLSPVLRHPVRHLLLDLGQVDYLSSMGLSVLLKTAVKLKAAGADCRVYDPQRSVRRVLEISKWEQLIVDPGTMAPDDPHGPYVRAEEPLRAGQRARAERPSPPRLYRD